MSLKGGHLIGMGSFGCVFSPSLKCPDEKESDKDIVSKLFFSKDGKKELNEEFKINSSIKNIPGYEEWANVWYKKCKTDEYIKLYEQDNEVHDCLEENEIDPHEFNNVRMMLQGNYGGVTFVDYLEKKLKKKVFASKKEFCKIFLDIVKCMKPLFMGLKEMYNKHIGHNDISNKNIVIHNNKCKYIDFGFSCKYNNLKFYKKRSSLEFISGRIYPPYPYEFIYLYATKDVLKKNDKKDIEYDVMRNLHDRYKLVHEIFFNRNTKEYLLSLISRFIHKNHKKGYIRGIISLLDTYSLGILLPYILCSRAKKYGKISSLKKYLLDKDIKLFVNLFTNMSEPDYFNRMNPNEVYSEYLKLEKQYLMNKSKNKKRTKRKK